MKWLLSPLPVLAGLLAVVLAPLWYFIFRHDPQLPLWFWLALACIPVFLVAAFILYRLPMLDEWRVGIQVALVLAPLITLVQLRDPDRDQTFVMIVPEHYTGPLEVHLVPLKGPYEKVNADTVYFRFDGTGRITLSETFRAAREAIEQHTCYLTNEHKLQPVPFYRKGLDLPSDTTKVVLVTDTLIEEQGRMTKLKYRLGTSAQLNANK